MAETDKSSSLVGSATKAISDAWDFFIPIFGRLFFLWLTTLYLGAWVILKPALQFLVDRAVSTSPSKIFALLDAYKLTSLLPVLVLIAIAAIASAFDRIVMILGSLVPLSITYSDLALLQQRGNPTELWYMVPNTENLGDLKRIVDVQCSKARALAYDDLLQNDDYWKNRGSKHYVQFTFSKFLLLWVFVWTVVLEETHRGGNGLALRFFGLSVCITLWGIYNTLQYAYALEQSMHARVGVALALMVVETDRLLPADDEMRNAINTKAAYGHEEEGWWWIGLPGAGWLREAGSMKSMPAILQQFYLRWF